MRNNCRVSNQKLAYTITAVIVFVSVITIVIPLFFLYTFPTSKLAFMFFSYPNNLMSIIGFLFRDFVETNLRKGEVIAYATIGFGLLLYMSDKLGKKEKNLNSLSLLQSFIIGIFQCLALIPGTSRSGITITAGFSK